MSMTGRYLRVSPATIAEIKRSPGSLLDVLHPESESESYRSRYLDIEKTWHIIHFLLNGEAWTGKGPLFDAVLGGSELTDEDLGYGPARYLEPAEVAAVAEALSPVSAEDLWGRFDESRVLAAELYWSVEPEGREYALENYQALRTFFVHAAAKGDAAILWLA
jgi:hypothetical protein